MAEIKRLANEYFKQRAIDEEQLIHLETQQKDSREVQLLLEVIESIYVFRKVLCVNKTSQIYETIDKNKSKKHELKQMRNNKH